MLLHDVEEEQFMNSMHRECIDASACESALELYLNPLFEITCINSSCQI